MPERGKAIQSLEEERNLHTAALANLMLATSARLADAPCFEIKEIIQAAVCAIRKIEVADHAGLFLLSEGGQLEEMVSSCNHRLNPTLLFGRGLAGLPWCLSELQAGRAVLLRDIADLAPISPCDHEILRDLGICSIALLPSNASAPGRGLLILLSTSAHDNWSEDLVDQCALLQNICWNAHLRKLAQDDAEASERSFQQLFRSSSLGMAVLSDGGWFLSANHSFCDIFGYSEEELLKMQCNDLTESTGHMLSAPLSQLLADTHAGIRQIEKLLIRKNGSVIPARIRASTLKQPAAEHMRSLIMVEDITNQKNAERALNKSQREVKTLAAQLIQSQENERKRLSRELHDDIGQRLSLTTSEIGLLSQHSCGRLELMERLASVRAELSTLCSDLHSMSHSLHSYKLEHLGLKSALKDLCLRVARPGLHIDLVVDGADEPQSKTVALCLYRVVQEAVSNAVRHAQTSTVAINLKKLQGTYYMTIVDSGIGFDTRIRGEGLGLVSMRERLTLVNGQLQVRSRLGRGTEIWVAIPEATESGETEADPESPSTQLLLTKERVMAMNPRTRIVA
jgi:PAS domain S-box-containing protein